MELYWLDGEKIAAAGDAALSGFTDGPDNIGEDADDPSMFRDSDGSYWFFDLPQRRWFRRSGSSWVNEQRPPARLEGSSRWLALAPNARGALPTNGQDPGGNTLERLQRKAARLRTAYDSGLLGSVATEELAHDMFVVDQQGEVWLPGLRSGMWYARERGRWCAQPAAPAEAVLCRPSAVFAVCPSCKRSPATGRFCPDCGAALPEREAHDAAILNSVREFVSTDAPAVPEPVTAIWAPPADVPQLTPGPTPGATARLQFCVNCGTALSANARFCAACGTAVGSVAMPAPVSRGPSGVLPPVALRVRTPQRRTLRQAPSVHLSPARVIALVALAAVVASIFVPWASLGGFHVGPLDAGARFRLGEWRAQDNLDGYAVGIDAGLAFLFTLLAAGQGWWVGLVSRLGALLGGLLIPIAVAELQFVTAQGGIEIGRGLYMLLGGAFLASLAGLRQR